MYCCELCTWEMPDEALYCGHCGGRKIIGDEASITTLTSIEGLPSPSMDVQVMGNAITQRLSERNVPAMKQEEIAAHNIPDQHNNEEPEHEPLAIRDIENNIDTLISDHTGLQEEDEGYNDDYNDEEDQHYDNDNDDEGYDDDEEDDDKVAIPFLPPWQVGAQNAPVIVQPLYLDPVPIVTGTPSIPTSVPSQPPVPPQGMQVSGNTTWISPQVTVSSVASPRPITHFAPTHKHQHTHHPIQKLVHRSRPTCLMMIAISIIFICIIAVFIAIWPKNANAATVLLKGLPQRGGHIIIYGDHFKPGEMVTIVVDPPKQGSATTNLAIGMLHFSSATSESSADTVTARVASDGTFEAPFFIPMEWPDGSQHNADVYNQADKLVKALGFTLPLEAKQFGLHGCPNDASPVTLGPVVVGSTQPVSKAISLCRDGSGPVNWSAHWDQKWLQLDQTGQIDGPQPGQLMLKALPQNLSPGSYTATVVFSSQESNVKVSRDVILLIMKKMLPVAPLSSPASSVLPTSPLSPQVPCVAAAPQALSFEAMEKQNSTLYAKLAITNCGDTGTWGTSITTGGGTPWLKSSSTSGMLPSGKIRELFVTASNANLKAGKHTGQITIHIGSSSVNIPVLFTIHAPAQSISCLNSDKQSLVFNGIIGESVPPDQYAKLTNCGSAGHLSALPVTDDGRNWLSASVPHAFMSTGDAEPVTVGVTNAVFEQGGTYKGRITFSTGSGTVTVNVIFNVSIPCISVPTSPLIFTTIEGQDNPPTRFLPLANCGVAANWYGAPSVDNGADWLQIDHSHGYLLTNAQQGVRVHILSKPLLHGIYTGHIVLLIGSSDVVVPVTLIVQQPLKPYCISTNASELDFTSVKDNDPIPQTLTLGNCGRAGTWSVSSSASWLQTDPSSGNLGVDGSQEVRVSLSSAGLAVGTQVKTLQFRMGDSTQTVTIRYTIQSPPPVACIDVKQPELSFTYNLPNNTTPYHASSFVGSRGMAQMPMTQTVDIVNCGDGGILSLQQQDGTQASWLHVSIKNNELDAGKSTQAVFTIDPTQISYNGSYTAQVNFTIAFTEDVTASKAVSVMLNVSQLSPLPPSSGPSSSPICIASPSSLSFSSQWGGILPAAQTISLTGCGANDTLNAQDDSDENLYIAPNANTFDGNGAQTVTVSVIASTYTIEQHDYTITFETGAGSIVKVLVHWEVQKPPIETCLNAIFASNYFNLTAGDAKIMSVSFPNCGGTLGTITLSPSTAKWLPILVDNSGSLDGVNEYNCGAGPFVTANIDTTNMAPGSYQSPILATINTSSGSQTQSVLVNLTVVAPSSVPLVSSPPPGMDTPTTTSTDTPIIATDTPMDTPTPTSTPTLTSAPTNTPALTNTSTGTPTMTNTTPTPTNTTSTSTPTNTPVATATATSVPTPTPVPTATPTATATVVPTNTPMPTATPVPSPTATPVPPPTATSVPTATPVPPPTATSVPPPTATPAPLPTATPIPPPTATPVPTP